MREEIKSPGCFQSVVRTPPRVWLAHPTFLVSYNQQCFATASSSRVYDVRRVVIQNTLFSATQSSSRLAELREPDVDMTIDCRSRNLPLCVCCGFDGRKCLS